MDRAELGELMAIEFLVVHSFPFMMLIGSLQVLNARGKKCRSALFWGMFTLYFAFALKLGGLSGVLGFAGLTVATYLGYLLRRSSPGAVAELAGRWLVSFLVFVAAAGVADVPSAVEEWPGHRRVLYFGLAYFLVLGIVEALGFYQRPYVRSIMENARDQLAAKWRKQVSGKT